MVQRMSAVAKEGDVVLLVSPDGKRYLIRLKPSEEWHCHKGCIRHDELIGKPLGRTLHTQYGLAILALEPSTAE
jgi:tRNA (adenine57-N1/adenine58-N1)-methyltransferase